MDLSHFLDHMLPGKDEEGGASHGHNGTVKEMLMLPELLEKPLAIVSMDAVEPMPTRKRNYKPVGVLFSCMENNKQGYKIAIVQPLDYYNGVVHGFCDKDRCVDSNDLFAAKIISYHAISELKFANIMSRAVKSIENLVYFDSDQYDRISFVNPANNVCKNLVFDNSDTKEKTALISNYSKRSPNLQLEVRKHINRVEKAIENAFMAYSNKSFLTYDNTEYPFVDTRLDICRDARGHSFAELADAYNDLVRIAQKYAQNPQDVIRKLTIDFATSYCVLRGNKSTNEFLMPYLENAFRAPVTNEEDYYEAYEIISDTEESIPTLKNLNIRLEGSDSAIEKALQLSNELQSVAYTAIIKIAKIKDAAYDSMLEMNDVKPNNSDIGDGNEDWEIGE